MIEDLFHWSIRDVLNVKSQAAGNPSPPVSIVMGRACEKENLQYGMMTIQAIAMPCNTLAKSG